MSKYTFCPGEVWSRARYMPFADQRRSVQVEDQSISVSSPIGAQILWGVSLLHHVLYCKIYSNRFEIRPSLLVKKVEYEVYLISVGRSPSISYGMICSD